ncbi:hypothetical protein LI328DRAFT_170241 [Trichoderma asperelloides]|nr:hypothetical protein LI328DRAFT_170241 [Trichoderma asperelloides]
MLCFPPLLSSPLFPLLPSASWATGSDLNKPPGCCSVRPIPASRCLRLRSLALRRRPPSLPFSAAGACLCMYCTGLARTDTNKLLLASSCRQLKLDLPLLSKLDHSADAGPPWVGLLVASPFSLCLQSLFPSWHISQNPGRLTVCSQ